MDILELLRKKVATVFPQAGGPQMDTAQHQQVVAASPGITMDEGGAGASIGQSLGSLAGNAIVQNREVAPQPVEAEKTPLGTVDDLTPRKPLPMPEDPKTEFLGGAGTHKIGTIVPAAGNPAVPLGQGQAQDPLERMMFPFGGYRAFGGTMYPGYRYRVGEEEVLMKPDGTAEVIPANDPMPTVQAEQQPLGQVSDLTPRQPEPVPGMAIQQPAQAAQPQAAAPMPAQPLSPRERLERDLAEIEGKDYSIQKVRNADGTVEKIRGKDRDDDHNILDVLKGIGWGALKGAKAGGLEGLLAGAAMGGAQSIFDRNYDEKMLDEWKRGDLTGKLNTVREGELADAKIAEQEGKAVNEQYKTAENQYKNTEATFAADGEIDSNEALILTALRRRLGMVGDVQAHDSRDWEYDEVGGKKMQRRKKSNDPWQPADGFPDDPTKAPVYATSPMSGQQVALTGSQLYSGESAIAAGNAQRQQAADTTNVNNDLSAQRENAQNLASWHSRETKRKIDAIGEFGKNLENLAEVQTINTQVQKVQQELSQLAAAGDVEGFTAKEEEFKALADSFYTALKKTQAGTQLVEMLNKTGEPKPRMVTAKKVNSSQVSTKVVSQSDLEAFAKSQNWTSEQATAYAKKNGWTIR